MVQGLRQERTSANVGGKGFRKKPQREYCPQRILPHKIEETRICRPPHPEHHRTDTLDYRQGDSAEHNQQEEVHEEEYQGAFHGAFGLCHEIPEKDRIIKEFRPVRGVQEDFDMSYDNQHEPSEGYAGVHVAEKFVPLPDVHVDEALQEDVLDVFPERGRSHEGNEEPLSVFRRQLEDDPHHSHYAVRNYERHSENERKHEIIVACQESLSHFVSE